MKIQGKPQDVKKPEDAKDKAGAKSRGFAEKLKKGQANLSKPEESQNPFQGPLPQGLLQPQGSVPQQQDHQKPEEISRIAAPAIPLPLQGLVSEIQTRVERSGVVEVEIQFNSQTFDGLRVNITKEAGAVAIKFTTNNDATAQLLTQHLPALSRALVNKGVAVSGVTLSAGAGSDSGKGYDNSRGRPRKGK